MRRLQLILCMVCLASPVLAQEAITGRTTVIDGDTIEIRGERIRLNGIDAPETAQLCKDAMLPIAAEALDKFLAASRPTRSALVERDRYGRFVGDCFRADGSSVAVLWRAMGLL